MEIKKGDILIIRVGTEAVSKMIRATGNVSRDNYGTTFSFDKMWDVMLQPSRRGGDVALDRGFIPISKALDMEEVSNELFIPHTIVFTLAKLNPAGNDFRELSAEAAGITLP